MKDISSDTIKRSTFGAFNEICYITITKDGSSIAPIARKLMGENTQGNHIMNSDVLANLQTMTITLRTGAVHISLILTRHIIFLISPRRS